MSYYLTDLQIKDAKRAFELFDKDNDGFITKVELEEMFNMLGIIISEEELKSILREIDTDGSQTIEFDQFLEMMAKRIKENDSEYYSIEVFRMMDRNCDGYISREELEIANQLMGKSLTSIDIDQIMQECETTSGISYDDFLKLLNPYFS